MFSNRHEVRGVELPALTARPLISSLKNTIALDWRRDPATGALQLYWTDVVDDNIYRGSIVGNGECVRVHAAYCPRTRRVLSACWPAGVTLYVCVQC